MSWSKVPLDYVAMAVLAVMKRLSDEGGIVLADAHGLACRAKLPIDVINRGLRELERETAPGFCRIRRLPNREGWQLANRDRLTPKGKQQ